MNAAATEFVVFDVETTGLSPVDGDRIIELAAARVRGGRIVETFESYLNPQRDIPEQSQRIHNISAEMVADAPLAADVLPRFIEFVAGACLCGQNVKFDLDFVCYEAGLAGCALRAETPAIDTIKMARYFLPQLTTYRLSSLAQAVGLKVGTTHRAMADVELTVGVLNRLIMLAEEQGFTQFKDILREFGVLKPKFRLAQNQDLLF
ncbi:MAG: PolC-type DNA polymerase III [Candidatus Omnitrophota bacterium]